MYASNTYVARISKALDAALMNKAIGAEVYFPELAEIKSKFDPDTVIVAYGTNDWVSVDKNMFTNSCFHFLQNVRKNYPKAEIVVITPIWRADNERKDVFSSFSEIDSIIREIGKTIANTKVVNGIDLVPHDTKFFGDLRIHPNDEGFKCYANNLIKELNL